MLENREPGRATKIPVRTGDASRSSPIAEPQRDETFIPRNSTYLFDPNTQATRNGAIPRTVRTPAQGVQIPSGYSQERASRFEIEALARL